MAVKRTTRKKPTTEIVTAEVLDPPEDGLLGGEEDTRESVEQRRLVRSLLFSSSPREIAFVLKEKYGIDRDKVKALIRSVRDENSRAVAIATKTARGDQMIALRTLHGQMLSEIAVERQAEDRARKAGQPYRARRNTATYGDVLACHKLIASVEGNFAPQKSISLVADVSTEVLDLLSVQSPEEVAEMIAEGRSHGR